MIYASQNAASANSAQPQLGISPIENHPLERQPSLQSQVNTEFAQITSQLDPAAAPEKLGRPDDVVYAVGYSAVDNSVAAGLARLPGRFYESGEAPGNSLEEAAKVHMGQTHPGAIWHSVEQQRLTREASYDDDDPDDEDSETGRDSGSRRDKKLIPA